MRAAAFSVLVVCIASQIAVARTPATSAEGRGDRGTHADAAKCRPMAPLECVGWALPRTVAVGPCSSPIVLGRTRLRVAEAGANA